MSSAVAAKMAELAARFATQANTYRQELSQADAEGDRGLMRDRAHKLAGIAPMLGHAEIGAAALTLEEAIEDGSDYRDALDRLDRCLAAVTA